MTKPNSKLDRERSKLAGWMDEASGGRICYEAAYTLLETWERRAEELRSDAAGLHPTAPKATASKQ